MHGGMAGNRTTSPVFTGGEGGCLGTTFAKCALLPWMSWTWRATALPLQFGRGRVQLSRIRPLDYYPSVSTSRGHMTSLSTFGRTSFRMPRFDFCWEVLIPWCLARCFPRCPSTGVFVIFDYLSYPGTEILEVEAS